jgi:hypothetical protein
MKSPRSAFPTWATYTPAVAPVGSSGAVNYDLRSQFGERGRAGGFATHSNFGRAAQVAAQQLATASGTGTQVANQMQHRPIVTALERARGRWAQHDWAEDVGDKPSRPGEVLSPPNLPPDYGSRVGYPPETVQVGDQTINIADFNARGQAAQQRSRQGSAYTPEERAPVHGNPAATATAQSTRHAIDSAAQEVLSNPKLVIPSVITPRKRK